MIAIFQTNHETRMSTTTRKKPIDLSKCKVGQRVKLRNGEECKLSRINAGMQFGYFMQSVTGDSTGSTHTQNGKYLPSGTSQHDVIAILHLPKKAKKAGKPVKEAKINTLDRFTTAFAKIAFKGDNDLIRKAAEQLEGLLKP